MNEQIDWSKAPEWAQYHAYDSDGRGGFHEHKPTINQWQTWWQSVGTNWPSVFVLPTGADWRQSLVERPKGE